MMISCKKAAELTCQGLDRPLSWWETLQLRFHVLMCRGCKRFMEQSRRLDELIARHFHDPEGGELGSESAELSRESCERMKQKLEEALRERGGRG